MYTSLETLEVTFEKGFSQFRGISFAEPESDGSEGSRGRVKSGVAVSSERMVAPSGFHSDPAQDRELRNSNLSTEPPLPDNLTLPISIRDSLSMVGPLTRYIQLSTRRARFQALVMFQLNMAPWNRNCCCGLREVRPHRSLLGLR
jgi:hypothetical protein